MKPHRADIALPPFPPGLEWIGGEPPAAERMTAKGPLLVIFFEAGELSSVRSLPHIGAWADRYRNAGLTTLGVHSPRNGLARDPADLEAALQRLGVGFPVAADVSYRVWHLYGCKGWPSVFLWGRGGRLEWFHLGIGGLADTEEAIRAQLRGGEEDRELPDRVHPVDADGDGRKMIKPSDEVFPSGDRERAWRGGPGEPLEVEYAGAGAWAALSGSGTVEVRADGGAAHRLTVEAPGLYELSEHPEHGMHEIRLDLDGEIHVWSVAFSAGTR